MALVIREYKDADSDRAVQLVRELQGHEGQYFDRLKPASEITAWYIENLRKACAANKGVVLVAIQDGELVGYAAVVAAASSEEAVDEVLYTYATVLDLAVAQSARRKGVATKLLEACEDHTRSHGIKWIRVSALAQNRDAIATYESFGFTPLLVTLEKEL